MQPAILLTEDAINTSGLFFSIDNFNKQVRGYAYKQECPTVGLLEDE